MKIKVLRSGDQKSTPWSGGQSTELFIYPATATYAGRDFIARLSTATVEVLHSEFTHLPGVSRILMVLSGELQLMHEDRYMRTLKAFQSDSFKGDWRTTSIGMVTDFNVMTRMGAAASLRRISLRKGTEQREMNGADCNISCYYVLSGTCRIGDTDLLKNDFLSCTHETTSEEINVVATADLELLMIRFFRLSS